jgi:uncharacterized protein YbjT (DUF2867 family)
VVLGASGGCGRWLVRLAAERGHLVTALIRSSARLDPAPGVMVRHGEVLAPGVLEAVLPGQEAVFSCLGLRRSSPVNPWSRLLSPPDLTTRVVRRLVPLMRQHGVARLLVISAGGVGDSVRRLTWPVTQLVRLGQVGIAYRDLAAMESVLTGSELDWLAVRPVTLVNGRPTGRAGPVANYHLWSHVRRSDVAAWMLGAMEEPAPYARRHVLLGTTMPWLPDRRRDAR